MISKWENENLSPWQQSGHQRNYDGSQLVHSKVHQPTVSDEPLIQALVDLEDKEDPDQSSNFNKEFSRILQADKKSYSNGKTVKKEEIKGKGKYKAKK